MTSTPRGACKCASFQRGSPPQFLRYRDTLVAAQTPGLLGFTLSEHQASFEAMSTEDDQINWSDQRLQSSRDSRGTRSKCRRLLVTSVES